MTVFHRLAIAEIRRETEDAVSIKFEVPESLAQNFVFQAGQYLTLKTKIAGEDIRRNYSVCASPLDGELRVAVKALRGGRFSTFANESLKSGDAIEVLRAAGHFTFPFAPPQTNAYAAFAAGSGITPILSLIKTALQTEPASRFKLFYGNRRASQILFLEQLAALKNRFMDRFEIYHFLSMEEEDIDLFNGRLDAVKCRDILKTLINSAEIDKFFICGPEGMMLDAEQALLAHGVDPEKILIERFLSAAPSPAQTETARAAIAQAAGRRMNVSLDGRRSTVVFDAALGNILDSVRAAGLPAPFACKGGVCATCRAKLVSGEVDMKVNYGLTADEVAQGFILTCQSTPKGDGIVLTYDV